jgi:arylsulfatase A-like enzyme
MDESVRPARLALVAGLAMYFGELLFNSQTRVPFRLEPWVAAIGLVYAAVPVLMTVLAGRWRGPAFAVRALNALLGVLTAGSMALLAFDESSVMPPRIRLVVGAAGALAVVPVAWSARRRVAPETATRLWATAWCVSVAAERLPRDLFLDAYNFQWRALAGRLGAAAAIGALAALWFVGMGLAYRRPRVGAGLLAGAAALVAWPLSGLGVGEAPSARPARGDIFFVILDALRFDYTSLPPQGGDATPAMAALAARGTSFADAHSPSLATEYSLPRLNGLGPDLDPPLTRWTALDPGWERSLPGALHAAGYRLHLLSDYPAHSLRGFDVYRWDSVAVDSSRWFRLLHLAPALVAIVTGREHELSGITGQKRPFGPGGAAGALDRLLDTEKEPGFYLVHLAVPHAPYDVEPYRVHGPQSPPEREALDAFRVFERLEGKTVDAATTERLRKLYSLAVRAADEQVAALAEVIQKHGRADDSLIVITADHGEPLGEHGIFGHGRTLHGEGHHVPLVIAGPGFPRGLVVDRPVSNADLPVTLVEWARGAEPSEASLQRATAADAPDRPIVVWHPRGTMVQHGRWRLAWTEQRHLLSRPGSWNHREEFELYDLVADPEERTNVFATQGPVIAPLLDVLESHRALPEATRAVAAQRRPDLAAAAP